MSKSLLQLAAEIVQAQVAVNRMPPEDIDKALKVVYNTLCRIQAAEEAGRLVVLGDKTPEAVAMPTRVRVDPIQVANSIQQDRVICLECGAAFRQLTANHLRSHGLTPREYKQKYGFPLKQPLSAKFLTAIRSEKAKKRGIPENLKKYQETLRQKKSKDRD